MCRTANPSPSSPALCPTGTSLGSASGGSITKGTPTSRPPPESPITYRGSITHVGPSSSVGFLFLGAGRGDRGFAGRTEGAARGCLCDAPVPRSPSETSAARAFANSLRWRWREPCPVSRACGRAEPDKQRCRALTAHLTPPPLLFVAVRNRGESSFKWLWENNVARARTWSGEKEKMGGRPRRVEGGRLPVACKVARSPARAERAVLGVLPKGSLSSRKILWP